MSIAVDALAEPAQAGGDRSSPAEATLLAVDGLTLESRSRFGEVNRIVEDVDLALDAGSVHALVGESGSGKTMVARAIVDLLPPGIHRRSGRIRFAGEDLPALDAEGLRRLRGPEIGFVFQEPMLSLNPAMRIGAQMHEALSLHIDASAAEIRERCLDMLDRVSIADPRRALDAYPHEFSGGMRQRIMLASVLSLEPRLLIADEPTTALDAIIQRDVLDLMVELTEASGTAVLLITHDLGLVAEYARDATVMQTGDVVESGPIRQMFAAPRTEYTRTLLAASPRRRDRPTVDRGGTPLLAVESLEVIFRGKRPLPWKPRPVTHAVRGIDLVLHRGENLAVVGESGSGKTTVGRAVLGLETPSAGTVRVDGEIFDHGDRRQWRSLRRTMQMVFQDPASSLDPRYRVRRLVAEGMVSLADDASDDTREQRVLDTLRDVGLDERFADRFPHELSGGQKQRVAIARAIVMKPELVIADEPVSALDLTVQAQVLELLADIQRDYGFSYFFISHDLGVVEQVADRILVMRGGLVVEDASRDTLFDEPLHPYTRRLLDASVEVRKTADDGFELSRRAERDIPPPRDDLRFHEPDDPYRLVEIAPGHRVALHAAHVS